VTDQQTDRQTTLLDRSKEKERKGKEEYLYRAIYILCIS